VGTDDTGASSPSTSCYLAEGCTLPDFETWVLVQNPGTSAARVRMRLLTDKGEVAGPNDRHSAGHQADVRPLQIRSQRERGDYRQLQFAGGCGTVDVRGQAAVGHVLVRVHYSFARLVSCGGLYGEQVRDVARLVNPGRTPSISTSSCKPTRVRSRALRYDPTRAAQDVLTSATTSTASTYRRKLRPARPSPASVRCTVRAPAGALAPRYRVLHCIRSRKTHR